MASSVALPRRKRSPFAVVVDVRRVSKPMLSAVILTATALVIAVVLLVWLLLWLNRPRAGIAGWWVAQRGLALPVIGHQNDDLRKVVKTSAATASGDVGYRALEQVLRDRLARAGTRPVAVYLSAVGVSDDQGGYLLRPEPGPLAPEATTRTDSSPLGVDELLDLFDEYPSRLKLLILDAGQVDSDRNLGIYANGFLHRLKSRLESKPLKGLVVLSSCAPGQVSWTSEADRSSVFGHYVALGLSGKASGWDPSKRGVTVRALHNYVREHVKSWVAANRRGEQTPELFGDPEVNFALPRPNTARGGAAPAAEKAAESAVARLNEGWLKHDALLKRRPFRHSPVLWQQYQETLLRGERLIRAGEFAEAESTLANLAAMESKIAAAAAGLPMDPVWSLALLDRHLDDQSDTAKVRAAERAAAGDKLDQALKELVGGAEEESEAPAEEGAERPAGPEKPPGPGSEKPAGAAPKEPARAERPETAGSPVTGSTKEKDKAAAGTTAAPLKPASPKRAKPKGESALSGLVARVEDLHPQYVEAQILVWADIFARRGLTPDAFKGARGELLGDALRTRRLAEKAAAPDERIARWIVPLVDAGDALRRRAQDDLFAGDPSKFEALARQLEQARERYRQALETADRAGKALDLVEQLEAELPYYGQWQARRGPRGDEGLDPAFVDLLKSTGALARELGAEVQGVSAGPAGPEEEEPLAAYLGQVRKWETRYRDLKVASDRLRDDFQGQCAGLAASGGSGRWREMDAALGVPLIEAEVRRRLLESVRSVSVAGTLTGPEGSAPPPAPAGDSLAEREVDKTLTSLGTARPGEASAEAPGAGGGGSSAPDPEYWTVALGLARLEEGLLELGGASKTDLARLSEAYEAARSAVKGTPERAFDAFAKFSALVRGLRAARLQALLQGRSPAYAPLAEADQALRVVPLADALGLSDKAVDALDRFQRHALLLWHGNRLLQDFAPAHARRLFEDAQQYAETEPLRAAVEAAGAMARARIDVKHEPEDPLIVGDWSEQPLKVGLDGVGSLPSGAATLLVGFDPALPVSVIEKASRANARDGLLVPVRAGRTSERKDYLVGRTESTNEPMTLRLNPVAFYRGRVFSAERGVSVTLNRANDPVAVTIQQSYEGLKFRDFTDQFKEHPGRGFLHYGTDLQYKLVLTTDRPVKAVVRYGLQEHPESFKTKTLDLGPKKKGEIIDLIKGTDFPILKADDQLSLGPLNLVVTVRKDRENGEIQGRAKYVFRVVPPSGYISPSVEFDPTTRTLYLWVTHLSSDPVTGPVSVIVSIGGSEARTWIRRGRIVPFSFQVPLAAKSVTWRVGVESLPNAFRETVDTPPPPGVNTGGPPPQ